MPPRSVKKLGVMVLPTVSQNIATSSATSYSPPDVTSIVPPSIVKAKVKAKKEFVERIVNPSGVAEKVNIFYTILFMLKISWTKLLFF